MEYWFQVLFFAFLTWNGLILAASIIYRKYRKSDQTPFDESTLVFNENWVSGSSRKNFLTRIGGAGKCLKVSVNKEEFYIRPFFPFQFLFLPELLDLEHRISRKNVRSIQSSSDFVDNHTTKIAFTTVGGKLREFDLYLNNEDEFTSLLQQMPPNTS